MSAPGVGLPGTLSLTSEHSHLCFSAKSTWDPNMNLKAMDLFFQEKDNVGTKWGVPYQEIHVPS